MSFEKESRLRVNQAEGREKNLESKDKQTEELEKKMGARERVELVSKEVQSTKQQMQNIMMNMQQVVKTVQEIRSRLGLTSQGGIPSVGQDEKAVAELKKKLTNAKGQLADLRSALKREEKQTILKEHGDWNEVQLEEESERKVKEILEKLGLDN